MISYYDYAMARTVVSTKFQVVIPKEIREEAGLTRGQKVQVISKGGVITLVPERPLSELKGFAPRARFSGFREKKDRF
jgi:AbrB family looped-hinge helix DNA binding protein